MLWIGLHFPQLALDTLVPGYGNALVADLPLVVYEGPPQRPVLMALNRAAERAGLKIGHTLAAARAVARALTALPRAPEKEAAALMQLATWLAQFTPAVAIEPAGIALEVESSLTLFGGIGALVKRIREGVRRLGFQALIGIAPTPLAAQLLARASEKNPAQLMCRTRETLDARLADIALAYFAWPPRVTTTLFTLGLTHIKHLQALPRAGLTRRFESCVLRDLDRARGLLPDPRIYFVVPEKFSAQHEFVFDVTNSAELLPHAEAMLVALEGFLRAHNKGTQQVALTLKHSRDHYTPITLAAREPARHAKHWLLLLREKFSNADLVAPVIEMSIKVDALAAFTIVNESLLAAAETGAATTSSVQILIDRVVARLGSEHVWHIACLNDHRPERAWQASRAAEATPPNNLTRPSWLLREPRPLTTMNNIPRHHGALTLLAGPERIDTGWWDGKPVTRDYFIAQNPQHEICWVYRDYRFGEKWYLHGFFG